MILKSGPRTMASDGIKGAVGSGQVGCFDSKSCHVTSVLGAIPFDKRVRQAFPYNPFLAREIAMSIIFLLLDRRKISKVTSLAFSDVPKSNKVILQGWMQGEGGLDPVLSPHRSIWIGLL